MKSININQLFKKKKFKQTAWIKTTVAPSIQFGRIPWYLATKYGRKINLNHKLCKMLWKKKWTKEKF